MMKPLSSLLLIIIFTSLGCQPKEDTAVKLPEVKWNNEDQLSVEVLAPQILTVVGENIKITPQVKNGTPIRFSVTPDLPVGLELDSTTGVVSGITALSSSRTQYNLNVFDDRGRSASVSIFLETRPDIFSLASNQPEVTIASGDPVDLKQFIAGGKGQYVFEIVDSSYGATTSTGIFTPSSKIGVVEFKVSDNAGKGSRITLTVKVGVPRITVNYTNPREGDTAKIELLLSGKSEVSSQVNYSIYRDAAMSSSVNEDSGSVIFLPGETTKTILVPTFNNNTYKDDAIFHVQLTIDSNLKFSDSETKTKDLPIVIANINTPPQVSFSMPSQTFVEFDINATFAIILNKPSSKSVQVHYSLDTLFSTASANDYVFTNGTATFNPGEITKTISVLIHHDKNGNAIASPKRTLNFKLEGPVGATMGVYPRHVITITDPLVVDINDERTDYILLNELQAQNWNGSQDILIRIGENGVLRSSKPTHGALSSGYLEINYPTTITLVNNGSILGKGGIPGVPQEVTATPNPSYCISQSSGGNGGDGGPAIAFTAPLQILNRGNIIAGGGGGGAGISAVFSSGANCANNKTTVFGGAGGAGADTGLNLTVPTSGETPTTDEYRSQFVSAGGAGGAPGEPGFKGSPSGFMLTVSVPGEGGKPGYVVTGTSAASFLRSCRYQNETINYVAYDTALTCTQKYSELINAKVLPTGLTVTELGIIKGR